MPELPDSFLEDINGLSNSEAHINEEENVGAEKMEEDIDDLSNVFELSKTQYYNNMMQRVEDALQHGSEVPDHGMLLEDDPECHQLIADCNQLLLDIENEIMVIHNFIRDKYHLKFPELQSFVQHPVDYARVVKKIGNEMDLVLVDLKGLLPSAIIIGISVSASTTSGKPLSEKVLEKTVEACDQVLVLDAARKKVLGFVESRLEYIAPNLSAIVGSSVAAKLIGAVGGLSALAYMASCDVQHLGAKRKNLAGFSSVTSQFREAYLEQTEIFQSTPPARRKRAWVLLALKSVLAARADLVGDDRTGKIGRSLREGILNKIEKLQEPHPPKIPKPHIVLDFKPKTKRGGRRLRNMKKRYAPTPMRKLANTVQFGVPEESSLGDGLGEGYGMLGQAGCRKLRLAAAPSKFSARAPKKFKRQYGSSGAASGSSSSLAFTLTSSLSLSFQC